MTEDDGPALLERFLLWRFNRQCVRRYSHMTPWRSCNVFRRGVCMRCYWRTLTGQHRRAKAAYIARSKAVAATLPRQVYARDVDGVLRYSHTLPPEDQSPAEAR